MKTEFVDLSDTRKQLLVEIPSTVVDAEIDRIARDYGKAARIPGFRPGKVPTKVVRTRFRDQILHDVAHDLIPRAVDNALRERGVEPVDTPDIKNVLVEEGQPLKFTADFETVPAFDPGDYGSLNLKKAATSVTDESVAEAMERLRQRAARHEPVEGRQVEAGDTVVVDLVREAPGEQADRHESVSIEIGASANPPGFDDQLIGLAVGDQKRFPVEYPDDHGVKELAGTTVHYSVAVKGINIRVVPAMDDEFAKDLGDFDSLDALRAHVREDLQRGGERAAERELRNDLLRQLAGRVTFEIPEALLEREVERRTEEFVRRLHEQGVDPRKANIDWQGFRDHQREPAREAVASAIVLDEVARREQVGVESAELDAEIDRYASGTGRTSEDVRARLEKEGGISRLYMGLRREKAVDLVRSRATIVEG
ncbi:MAG: trigger factor [Vicinamibacteria bacterium]|nr:trigger factor [Vicinamibacteria bacterium]